MSPIRRRPLTAAVVAAVAALTLAGCVSAPEVASIAASPSASASSTAATTAPPPVTACSPGPTVSYPPSSTSAYVSAIKSRAYLLVGVSADTRLFGAVDPQDPTTFRGFDIAMAKLVAKAVLGDENKIRFRVISAADRQSLLQKEVDAANNAAGGVDLVARAYTMNCDRWQQVNFSASYFLAHQGLMVPKASALNTKDAVAKLSGKTVCAPRGTTSLANIAKLNPQAKTVGVANHTDCVVLLQQGAVDAITGDDAILAGFKAQDPNTVVVDGVELSNEPYGLGIPKAHPDFAAFVNGVLAQAVKDGSWQKAYADSGLAAALGPGTPPTPQYGR